MPRKAKEIVVIKVGTDVLKDMRAFASIARQVKALKALGFGVVIVTSGAVAAGRSVLAELEDPVRYIGGDIASVGALPLLMRWDKVLRPEFSIAQIWIEHSHFRNKWKRRRLRISVRRLAFGKAIPIVNENDVISAVEIYKMRKKRGDNDVIARKIAVLIEATYLIMVTKAGGIYTRDPEHHADATLLEAIPANFRKIPKGDYKTSKNGTGGPRSKMVEAIHAFLKGVFSAIVGLKERNAIVRTVLGRQVGTRIVADTD